MLNLNINLHLCGFTRDMIHACSYQDEDLFEPLRFSLMEAKYALNGMRRTIKACPKS